MSPWGKTNLIGRVDCDLRNGRFDPPKQCEESLSSPISPNDNIINSWEMEQDCLQVKALFLVLDAGNSFW